MAVEFKPTMTKAELLKIANEHGVSVDDGMTKAEIIAALEGTNEAESVEGGTPAKDGAQSATEGAQSGADSGETPGASGDTANEEHAAESAQDDAEEYDLFIYAGPSIPKGRLKENAVFNGKFEDVTAYLADVLADFPTVEKLIVPVKRFAAFSAKVKTPGNIAHKYYSDIVSTIRGNKEV